MMKNVKDGWRRLSKLSKPDLAAAVAAAEDGDVDPVLFSTENALMRMYHLQISSNRPLTGEDQLGTELNKILEVRSKPCVRIRGSSTIKSVTILQRCALRSITSAAGV